MLLILMLFGVIGHEDYYNLQGPNWTSVRVLRWLAAGKPQAWFAQPPWQTPSDPESARKNS